MTLTTTNSPSLTASVYAQLRSDILAARLHPGEKLKIDALCERLSAGSSAVREALSRLAAEGFVSMEPQRGFRVTLLSIGELRDLTRTRIQVETLCLRQGIPQGDVEWETELIATLHRMSRTAKGDGDDPKQYSQAYSDAHTAFHEALISACDSPWLLTIRRLLFAQSERYRFLSRPLAMAERDLDSEHRAIAEAALARDVERCVDLMHDHLMRTAQTLIDAAERGDAPF